MPRTLDAAFEHFKDKTIFIQEDKSVSYANFKKLISSFVEKINLSNINKKGIIYYRAGNSINDIALLLALVELKLTICLISDDASEEQLMQYNESLAANHVVKLSSDKSKFVVEQRAPNFSAIPKLVKDVQDRDHCCIILFSSGSSGKPKAIVYDFEKIVNKFSINSRSFVFFPVLKIDHFGGLNTLLGIISSGSSAVLDNDKTVHKAIKLIQKHRIQILPATPTFLKLLLLAPNFASVDLSSIKVITYGTEPMPSSLLDHLNQKLPGVKLKQTYGLSEVGVLATSSENSNSTFVKIGGNGFEWKIKDNILWIKSDFAMEGYIGLDAPFDEEGFFNTQDLVEVKGDYIKFLGRDSELINIAGLKVYPQEIEDVLMTHPLVADVTCSSQSNSLVGTIIQADVVIKHDANARELKKELRLLCEKNLEKYKVPSRFIFSEKIVFSERMKKKR